MYEEKERTFTLSICKKPSKKL